MNTFALHDCNTQLKQIHEALNAIRSVTMTIEEHPDNAREMLIVIRCALDSVIEELEGTISVLDGELSEQNN